MSNPNHDKDLIVMGYCISSYLRSIPQDKALQYLSTEYSKEAIAALYEAALKQEDYEVCILLLQQKSPI